LSKTKCILGCSFIVGKDNYKHIFSICKKLKEVGVDHVKISGVVIGNSPLENNEYHKSIKEEVRKQISMAKKLSNNSFGIIDHYHDLEGRFKKEYHICPYILFRPVIGADCNVYTCQDKAYTQSGKLGNIKNVSFKDYWFSKENHERVFRLDPSVSCNHHCISQSKNIVINEYLSIDSEHLSFT
jgi:MoaA/NifB/PqqE/SkfB family radical SAM enzyme